MFGALKLHGPVLTTVDEDNNLNGVGSNPYTWARKHNVIYIDNPVGAGEKIVIRIQINVNALHNSQDTPSATSCPLLMTM